MYKSQQTLFCLWSVVKHWPLKSKVPIQFLYSNHQSEETNSTCFNSRFFFFAVFLFKSIHQSLSDLPLQTRQRSRSLLFIHLNKYWSFALVTLRLWFILIFKCIFIWYSLILNNYELLMHRYRSVGLCKAVDFNLIAPAYYVCKEDDHRITEICFMILLDEWTLTNVPALKP